MSAILITFLAGAAYESGCVFWVHYSEQGARGRAAGWSMFNALVTVIGVEGFLHSLPCAAAYVLGFGVGTWVAIDIKQRWLRAAATGAEKEAIGV